MDLPALATLDALLGNDTASAAIEWALTGGEIEFTAPAMIAIGGAECDAQLDGSEMERYRVYRAASGSTLSIREIVRGRFGYLAVAGGFDVPLVMASRSTYIPGAFGGFHGRRLKNGDTIGVRFNAASRKRVVIDRLPSTLRPPMDGPVRIIVRDSPEILLDAEWKISSASDRMGYRLDGTAVIFGASIISEPMCPGVIELPPSGEPIILMADAPTIGGYRILATVIEADLGILAQMQPGSLLQFEPVTVEAAQRAAIDLDEKLQAVKEWASA
jgi:biotin-dependent carboxylase-like uncharacterized protein